MRGLGAATRLGAEGRAMTSMLLGLGLLGAESLFCPPAATELEGAWSGTRVRSHLFDSVNLLEGLDVFDLLLLPGRAG